jgi:two-component system chemotaxis sensor kinase CheA
MAKDPYRYFRIEARELVEQLGQGLLDLEKGPGGAEPVQRLLRLAHTIKGAARVVKQVDIANLIHGVEEALAPHRDGSLALERERVDEVLAACDAINARLAQLPQPHGAPAEPARTASAPEAAPRLARADVLEVDMLLEGLGEIGSELAALRRSVAQLDTLREIALSLQDPGVHAAGRARALADRLGELAGGLERSMTAGAERIDRELRQTRDAAERLRLIPVASVFHALERTARDAAISMGKQLAFEASGGELRIDGEVLDAVQGALVQLVRNAVAHGIETPAQRRAAGKDPCGRITLEVARRGYRVWFRCSDDGRGVDLDAVRRVLAERAPAVHDYSAAELVERLLQGGISTSPEVTALAGRGIGLDVVRAAMLGLNGEVHATNNAGRGLAIELRVPLSLAALDVLMVEADGQLMALPLDAVKGTLRVAPDDIIRTPDGDLIAYRGQTVTLVPLTLGMRAKGAHRWSPQAMTAVILGANGALCALAMNRLRGIDSVVLRPLPALSPADPVVLGLHLDSEGNPRLVLDPEVLAGAMRVRSAARQEAPAPPKPILIVDDSLTTRMLECSILESAGFSVAMAASAEEGLEMARRTDYALFLVDVIECTRADPQLRAIPSILVTSCDAPEYRQRGVQVGAAAYIVKNEFDQVDFLQRVGALVQV